ncbi:MAG TPA: hypothetical protein VGN12_15575 [Pirellulales bacterium]
MFSVNAWWRPNDIGTTGRALSSRDSAISLSYLGKDIRLVDREGHVAAVDPKWDMGDINIDFDPAFLEEKTATVECGERLDRADLDRIDDFVFAAIRELQATDAILTHSLETWRGPVVAAEVFHRDPIDFLRDLARELFLLEASLENWEQVALGGRLGKDIPRVRLPYHSDSLHRPETLLTDSRLKLLSENCARATRTLQDCQAAVISRRQTNNPHLLDLAATSGALRQSIESATPQQVCEALAECEWASMTQLGHGFFVKHDGWDWNFPTVYDYLATQVLEKRFVS